MKNSLWFKGCGKITEPILIEFIELWDESTPATRVEFLKSHAPHLNEFEVKEYISREANRLRRGVLIALCALFEGEAKADSNA